MRRIACLLVLPAVFSAASACAAIENRDVTGLEWLQLSAYERGEHVLRSMAILSRSGAELAGTADRYYDALHERLRRNPAQYGSTLTSLLAALVYETEPSNRAALGGHLRPGTPRP